MYRDNGKYDYFTNCYDKVQRHKVIRCKGTVHQKKKKIEKVKVGR